MSSTLQEYIQQAIESHGHLLTPTEKKSVLINLNESQSLKDDISSHNKKIIDDDYISCCTFIKITQKKITPQFVFGSHIKSECLNEISLCEAKISNEGEIVPDESKIILKAFVTELALSEAIFNTMKHDGEPITFTQFGKNTLDSYQPSITMAKQFEYVSQEKKIKTLKKLDEVIHEATLLQDKDIKLNNKTKAKLLKLANDLDNLLRDELGFDLEQVKENLEREFVHINSEIISSVLGHLKNLAQNYLENKMTSEYKSLHERFFIANNSIEIKLLNSKLLSLLLNDTSNQDEKDNISYHIKRLTLAHEHVRLENSSVNKGMINFGKTSGGSSFIFGDSRKVENLISIDFSFGYDYISDHGSMRYETINNLAKVTMTNIQFMELLQSGMTNNWTKCTSLRYLGGQVKLRNNDSTNHDPYKQEKIKGSPLSKKIKSDVRGYIDKASTNSQSVKARESLLSILIDIKVHIEESLDQNKEIVDDASADLLQMFKEQNSIKIKNLLEMAGERKEIPNGLLNHIQITKNKEV
jgi:hypothetical protein